MDLTNFAPSITIYDSFVSFMKIKTTMKNHSTINHHDGVSMKKGIVKNKSVEHWTPFEKS